MKVLRRVVLFGDSIGAACRRLLVSRDEFYAALKAYYRVAGLICDCTDGALSSTTDAFSQAGDAFEAYVQGEPLREY